MSLTSASVHNRDVLLCRVGDQWEARGPLPPPSDHTLHLISVKEVTGTWQCPEVGGESLYRPESSPSLPRHYGVLKIRLVPRDPTPLRATTVLLWK